MKNWMKQWMYETINNNDEQIKRNTEEEQMHDSKDETGKKRMKEW